MAAERLVLFGAGMTGRGQVAQLAHEAGWQLCLVDSDAALVERLRAAGQYTVQLLGAGQRDVLVTGYQACHTSDAAAIAAAVAQADLVVTSVLSPNLPAVAQTLAPAIASRLEQPSRPPLNVIAAENMDHGSTTLRALVRAHLPDRLAAAFDSQVGFPDSMISRVVPIAADPLFILTEEYSEWTADRHAVRGQPPALAGLEWVDNQAARLQQKLFIHNTGHVICGYLGWLAGCQFIHEAAQDASIMPHIAGAIAQSGAAVAARHGFSTAAISAYQDHLLGRLVISALADDIRRVIRHPVRKLGQEERLLGPLQLCEEFGLPYDELCYGIAAVLAGCDLPYAYEAYGDGQSERIASAVQRYGPAGALNELVGYQPAPATARQIERAHAEIASGLPAAPQRSQ